ncbi:hypothetical protein GO755_33425 [Spirosoma sp. HMF4905]|uniref:Uncharacterized protein n=1 Tax=Spirosoma arboris TaxID=2682092 RepID=A0A7K1SMG8_9BACT|nr:hypothetical protein [Spirosoma arboris]MVM34977.1 hypothetical protein [Spirosoma arboris]
MTRSAIQLLLVLFVVGLSAFAYDWYYRKPARDERNRSFRVNKVNYPDAPISYESFA